MKQLVFPELLLIATPEPRFISRLRAEADAPGSEVSKMLAGQAWLMKRKEE